MALANIKAVASSVFGEGPHWDAKNQDLLYVDFLGHAIRRYVPRTGQQYKVDLGTIPSVVIPVDGQDNKYLVTYSKELQLMLMDWDGTSEKPNSMKLITEAPKEEFETKCEFNDGKCDSQGRLWLGTFGGAKDGVLSTTKGNLYKLGSDSKSWTRHVDQVKLSNGMGWTADSSKFFYVDSVESRIDSFDFDPIEGTLSNRQVVHDLIQNKTKGFADGMTVDAQNNIWVATYMGAKVLHIDTTTGQVIEKIDFSGRTNMLTSVTFGGPNLDTLYVTSVTLEMPDIVNVIVDSDQKDAGALFEVTNIGAKGIMGGGVNFKGKLPSFP